MEALELWFDFSCPYAYLASQKAPGIARAAGVPLDWKPMLLGGVFRGIGAGDGPMPTLGPAKAAHNLADMQRWAKVFGVPLNVPAAHPMRTVRALRTLLGLPHSRWPQAITAIYAAYWQRNEDITRDEVIAATLADIPEAPAALANADSDAIKAELRARTDEAIGHGIFGAPAWRVRGQLIWGQDRMPWVEAALAGWNLQGPPPGGVRPFGTGVEAFTGGRPIEMFFDVASPFAYFALTQVPALARLTGSAITMTPILLGGLFRDIGQVDVPLLAMPEAKRRYVGMEMKRWSDWWGVPFDMPSKFPQRSIAAQRLLTIPESFADRSRLAIAIASTMWARQQSIEDPATLAQILSHEGFPAEWLDRTNDPSVKQQLIANTARAKDRGVFGVPTFVIGDELVWGQDRLDLVLRYAGGWT
ncbi:MAG: 2-hydroxychromene-2-carboxylate isomerase [Kofleriaceae bacterium]